MSGLGIGDLGLPPRPYRVDQMSDRFETERDARLEDEARAEALACATLFYPYVIDPALAQPLAVKLADYSGRTYDTLASSTYMRGLRINIAGAIWQLIDEVGAENVRPVTIIPATWEFWPWVLEEIDPAKFMKALRSAFHSRGAAVANGWFIGFIHGEFDPISDVFRLHVHGFAYGGMVEVVDRLRMLPNYSTQFYLPDGELNPVYRRVMIGRKPLTNVPHAVTYALQSYWPSRALIIRDDGKRIRARQKQRIEEPYHSQVLLWLDRWRIEDLTLMIGLRVTGNGLLQTKLVS